MNLFAASWTSELSHEPGRAVLAVLGLVVVTTVAGLALRALNGRARSLRHQVLTITVAALGVGATAALLLAWLMVLDAGELTTVLGVLALTAIIAAALVVVGSAPLGHDARRLETTVRRIEDGDRTVRTSVSRADELGHVATALDQLTARLDHLERERAGYEAERAAMLSSVSHDLRTPLAALRAAIEAVQDGVAPDPDRYLRSMQRDVDALTALVDDLFLLTQLDHGHYHLHSAAVDLTEVADEAVEALAPVAARRDVHLELRTDGRVRVNGNATALGRVIRNLLDNAIRHAPAGSCVRVIVDDTPQPRVRVVDEGPGFADDFAPNAFDHFTRADPSRNRETGGAGLGLAIARGMVEAHGGRIWIDAPPGGHVTFELPAA